MPPREFVDCITDDLLGQGVFVFTPSGAPMRLPKVRASSALPAMHHKNPLGATCQLHGTYWQGSAGCLSVQRATGA